jgi:hypothetical protein
MKSLPEIQEEVKAIIRDNPELPVRFEALTEAGYKSIKYAYTKAGGIGSIQHLKRKHIYRIQVSHSELKKTYPAAWVIDIPEANVDWYTDLPF